MSSPPVGSPRQRFVKRWVSRPVVSTGGSKCLQGNPLQPNFIDITEPDAAVALPPPVAGNADWQVELELGAGLVLRLRTR